MEELYALCKNPPSLEIWNRFWAKVSVGAWTECWQWNGAKSSNRDKNPYGCFRLNGRTLGAPRLLCQWIHGELPKFLVVDHIVCDNPSCVNPLHLIPTTTKVNILRGTSKAALNAKKTHCPKGHPLVPGNLKKYEAERGGRICRTCASQRVLNHYYKSKS